MRAEAVAFGARSDLDLLPESLKRRERRARQAQAAGRQAQEVPGGVAGFVGGGGVEVRVEVLE